MQQSGRRAAVLVGFADGEPLDTSEGQVAYQTEGQNLVSTDIALSFL